MDELLDDTIIVGDEIREFEVADKGIRFVNFFIDRIVVTIFMFGVGMVLALFYISAGNEEALLAYEESISIRIMEYILGAIATVGYYVVCEYYFKGKTIGKLLTKTRAVTLDNKRMDLGTAMKRSLSRIVPFEPFSFLGTFPTGWHDKWSDTKVIVDTGWEEEF